MRLSLCLYAGLLFAACGSVHLKNVDSGEFGRGEAGSSEVGTGGSTGAGGAIEPTMDASVQDTNVATEVHADVLPDTSFTADVNDDVQTPNNCDMCKLNCVNTKLDGSAQAAFDYCNGCFSNCPVNGIKLLCHCNNGCGYIPAEGTCNE